MLIKIANILKLQAKTEEEILHKEDFTFFGTKKVDPKTKTILVDKLFSAVSDKYDIMNDLMSGGIHRIWKDIFCMMIDNPEGVILDMAGGTGDITRRIHNFSKSQGFKPSITICDLNIEMLSKAQEKLLDEAIIDVNYINSSAENLPFANNSFDYYVVAFGIRNFSDMSKSLKEAKRVLKKGGKFLCMEFSKPRNMILHKAYDIYSKYVIPNLGSAFGDKESYQYLVESIEKFPPQEEFAQIITDAGFSRTTYRNLSGGIVAIHSAIKL